MLSHTPPSVVVSSYEAAHKKRQRSGSISGRLRSAAALEERGFIDGREKGVLKDLIINGGDERLQSALDKFEGGDTSDLEVLMQHGVLSKRGSLDLLEDLDMNFLQVACADAEPAEGGAKYGFSLSLDDVGLEAPFEMDGERSSLGSGGSIGVGLGISGASISPSMLGRTPPDPFTGSFEENAKGLIRDGLSPKDSSPLHSLDAFAAGLATSSSMTSSAIDIPGTAKDGSRQLAAMVDSGLAKERATELVQQAKNQAQAVAHPLAAQQIPQQHFPSAHPNHTQPMTLQHRQILRPGVPVGTATLGAPPTGVPGATGGDPERKHFIGAYSPEARRKRIQRFLEKRKKRVWTKKVKYDVRKNFADSRMRVKGRFVKKEDEELLRELMSIT